MSPLRATRSAAWFLVTSSLCGPATAESVGIGESLSVFLCQIDDQTEAFVLETYPDGSGTLRGHDGSKVARSGSAYSAIVGPTLIQIEDSTIRKVERGAFSTGTCASADGAVESIVDSAMYLVRQLTFVSPYSADVDAALAAAPAQRDESRDEAAELRAALRAFEAARDAYAQDVEDLRVELAAALAAKLAAEREARKQMSWMEERLALLATARRELAESEAARAEMRREVSALTDQVVRLRQELGILQALLDDADEEQEAAELRIEKLNEDLATALARSATEE